MDADSRKTALRTIPYGLCILTAKAPNEAAGVKADSSACDAPKMAGGFALDFSGKGQPGVASMFFEPTEVQGGKISGREYRDGSAGVECALAEVVEASVPGAIEGRPDDAVLHMRDLGETVFYGG